MLLLLVGVFILGYIIIAFEHTIKIDKSAIALITGVLCWVVYILNIDSVHTGIEQLYHHVGEIASILFFLLGAMAIVELIDLHNGFDIIISKVQTKSKFKFLWIIGVTTFIISSVLDNLTTAIVMSSLIVKVLPDKEDRLWFVSVVVLAANAGGAFSPLGDVTTTMLWIGGQITASQVILKLFIPSVAVLVIPLIIISQKFKNQTFQLNASVESSIHKNDSLLVLGSGIFFLLFVPVFKTLTHLPPFMGILLALGILWILVSILHRKKPVDIKEKLSVASSLERIDTPSILFFLGILLAVSTLASSGYLKLLAIQCDQYLVNFYGTGIALGLISAIVDNVPLVAAAQGMYDLNTFPTDHPFWLFLALTSGTGGSIIIIGSAAGVAAMGIENINFMWYLRKFSLLALLGFISGIVVFFICNGF
ncbi:MAG: sodium:proton antiporter NhaD [Saprospiraceae bacterium]|nr:sodium:proton antiporter NhaD [Saprospiraceae bacterium]